jgi:hypothetical protein
MSTSNLTKGAPTAESLAADQARLDNIEAANGTQEDAIETGQDAGGEAPEPALARDGYERKVINRSPQDDVRSAIAARFTRGEDRPFDGDMTNPENLYGDVAKQPALEPDPEESLVGEVIEEQDAAADADPVPQPRMITRKVRGQDVTLSEDEWLERAMKVTAADSYLEESRKLLEEAEKIKAERAGRDRQHPDGQSSTQDDGPDVHASVDPSQRPENDLDAVVEQIQYGDPKEAAKLLKDTITKVAAKAATEDHVQRLFNNDLKKSQDALKSFRDANPDLDNDRIAAKVIEESMYDIYREELIKLGLDEGSLPKTNAELANWHRYQRIHGFAVSDTPKLLNEAKARLDKWRGRSSEPPKPTAPTKPAARVEVNVDRSARRAAIPNQPTRASLPRPAATPPAKTSGSDVVAEMRRARGQITV